MNPRRVPSEAQPIRYTTRWFCYLDLLGFRQLVESHSIEQVLPLYERALAHIERAEPKATLRGISYAWFSDTFIIYSRTDSPEAFSHVEQAGRLFFQELLLAQIPVRGAISCGDLYSLKERGVFIGRALIEAYLYGEGQDWIGFSLTPSAVRRMDEIELPARRRAFYRPVPPDGVLKPNLIGPVHAFAFNNARVNGANPYLRVLKQMRAAAPLEVAGKYDRTIAFLTRYDVSSTTRPNRQPNVRRT